MATVNTPFGEIDERSWDRIKHMRHAEVAAYVAALEAHLAATQHALASSRLIGDVWAKHPECATLDSLREAERGNPRTVVFIETAASDWRRVGELEAEMSAAGWLDDDERSVILSASGEPMLVSRALPGDAA